MKVKRNNIHVTLEKVGKIWSARWCPTPCKANEEKFKMPLQQKGGQW